MRATSPPSVATSVEGTFFFKFVTKKSCRSLSDPILIVFAFAFFLVITADWVEERRYSHVGNKRSFQCCCSSQHQGLMCSMYGLTLGLHNTSTVNYGCFSRRCYTTRSDLSLLLSPPLNFLMLCFAVNLPQKGAVAGAGAGLFSPR